MNAITICLYFLTALLGLFVGCMAGLAIRSTQEKSKDRKRYYHSQLDGTSKAAVKKKKKEAKRKEKLRMKQERKAKRKNLRKKEDSLLKEETTEGASLSEMKCSDSSINGTELIEKMRERQDDKYLYAKRKEAVLKAAAHPAGQNTPE